MPTRHPTCSRVDKRMTAAQKGFTMVTRTYHDRNNRWSTHQGDVQSVLPTLSSNLFDAAIADPSYGVGFIKHGWDSDVPLVKKKRGRFEPEAHVRYRFVLVASEPLPDHV